jgi:hypothetical protein
MFKTFIITITMVVQQVIYLSRLFRVEEVCFVLIWILSNVWRNYIFLDLKLEPPSATATFSADNTYRRYHPWASSRRTAFFHTTSPDYCHKLWTITPDLRSSCYQVAFMITRLHSWCLLDCSLTRCFILLICWSQPRTEALSEANWPSLSIQCLLPIVVVPVVYPLLSHPLLS